MTFNFKTKVLELDERERGILMIAGDSSKLSTGTIIKALAATYTANFEEDVASVIDDFEELETA